MLRLKTSHLALMLGLIAPVCSYSADFCIKVNGGYTNGGVTFVGKGFLKPAANTCKPWAGWARVATSVFWATTGSACMSSNNKVLQLTLLSTGPSYLGSGVISSDHIRICPTGTSACPVASGVGVDASNFNQGPAAQQACTTALTSLPAVHD
jgi:hypothetical protein